MTAIDIGRWRLRGCLPIQCQPRERIDVDLHQPIEPGAFVSQPGVDHDQPDHRDKRDQGDDDRDRAAILPGPPQTETKRDEPKQADVRDQIPAPVRLRPSRRERVLPRGVDLPGITLRNRG